MDKITEQLKTDFKRMDLMLQSFQRIAKKEREWFIDRLISDNVKLTEIEDWKNKKPKRGHR